jgi:hypothetical protein
VLLRVKGSQVQILMSRRRFAGSGPWYLADRGSDGCQMVPGRHEMSHYLVDLAEEDGQRVAALL